MRHKKQKPVPFPLLILPGLKKELTKKAIELDVNRTWLTMVFIDYGYRNLTDIDISLLAENDAKSTPASRKLKK